MPNTPDTAPTERRMEEMASHVPSPDGVRQVGSWAIQALRLDRAGSRLATRRDPVSGVLSVHGELPTARTNPDVAPIFDEAL